MKDYEIENLVSGIAKAAAEFSGTQQLRQVISNLVVPALKTEQGELEALRAENERLKYREKNCATENQAMLVGAVRFMQEVSEAVGMTMADSPAQILETIKSSFSGRKQYEYQASHAGKVWCVCAKEHYDQFMSNPDIYGKGRYTVRRILRVLDGDDK